MWISFTSITPFAVKVHVGGINAVSGEPAVETPETMMRRLKLIEVDASIQDYIVSPKQMWLDGIANTDGTVRQFVAMPLGTGYSVEAQITGMDLVGGIQIKVTPSKLVALPPPPAPPRASIPAPRGAIPFPLTVKSLTGKSITFQASDLHTVADVKEMVCAVEGVPQDQQRLVMAGRGQLDDPHTLGKYNICKDSIIYLALALRGGGNFPSEMGLAAGGLIKQTIVKDRYEPDIWDTDNSAIFNVQILNSAVFKQVTGKQPPESPVTAQAYAQHGFPYFDIFDEKPSGIKGDFWGVKSVNEKDMEGKATWEKVGAVAEVVKNTRNPIVVLNKEGKRAGFRPVKVMKKEVMLALGDKSDCEAVGIVSDSYSDWDSDSDSDLDSDSD